VLPSTDTLVTSKAVASTLSFSTYYNLDGTQQYSTEPAAGGLSSETVDYKYDDVGLPTSLTGYLLGTSYSALGQVKQLQLGTSSDSTVKKAYITNTFEEGTDRLTRSLVTDATRSVQDLNYSYDGVGNVTSIFDPTTLSGTGAADYQCFTYDGYRRLTNAWTPSTADCATSGRTTVNLGGSSPYWNSYTYASSDSGLRATETAHTTSGNTAKTYCYDAAKIHQLAGDHHWILLHRRHRDLRLRQHRQHHHPTQRHHTQSLTWTPEGQLDTLTEKSSPTPSAPSPTAEEAPATPTRPAAPPPAPAQATPTTAEEVAAEATAS
jgi:hypothetical protein